MSVLGRSAKETKGERTRADGVVHPLELVARREVLALGRNAAEIIRVVLEARSRVEQRMEVISS